MSHLALPWIPDGGGRIRVAPPPALCNIEGDVHSRLQVLSVLVTPTLEQTLVLPWPPLGISRVSSRLCSRFPIQLGQPGEEGGDHSGEAAEARAALRTSIKRAFSSHQSSTDSHCVHSRSVSLSRDPDARLAVSEPWEGIF